MWQIAQTKRGGVKKKLEEAQLFIKTDEIARNNALIRFFYGKNPKRMSDSAWAHAAEEINFVLRHTGQLQEFKQ